MKILLILMIMCYSLSVNAQNDQHIQIVLPTPSGDTIQKNLNLYHIDTVLVFNKGADVYLYDIKRKKNTILVYCSFNASGKISTTSFSISLDTVGGVIIPQTKKQTKMIN